MLPYTRDFLVNHPLFSSMDIGEYSYGTPLVKFWGYDISLTIGKFCSIAENVTIFLGGDHAMDIITTYPLHVITGKFAPSLVARSPKRNVIIGNDVWIGAGATIMSGVTIGDGACIGANAVVGKDVAPYALVVGNSARLVRFRFDPEVIIKLLEAKWWDWPYDVIVEQFDLIMSDNIDGLLDFARQNGLSSNNCIYKPETPQFQSKNNIRDLRKGKSFLDQLKNIVRR